jgi:hypothetical protein
MFTDTENWFVTDADTMKLKRTATDGAGHVVGLIFWMDHKERVTIYSHLTVYCHFVKRKYAHVRFDPS